MQLTIDHVSKHFAQKKDSPLGVLDDMQLTIKAGEFVSLLGPSGCGKSTLLSMIAGLLKPSSGTIYFGDKPIKAPGPDRGVVFQEAALFPWMSVRDNVKFPLRKKYGKKEQTATANRYLQMVQLSQFPEHFPHQLSGGMQQRVSIARVLAMDPQMLLMDEPFGALDEQTRSVLQDEVERIWQETQKTIVFVTHSIREAIKLSDRIVIMGARPSQIIADIPVDLPRPRIQEDMALLEEEIMGLLKEEIDKVMREELHYAGSD